jgi:gamma-glutamylcyclotransferase (GGCT)/AIG2-like uncharacterized protein YtfP
MEASDGRSPRLLFAYGTLGPGGSAAGRPRRWAADAVRGRLFDLGPYPALVDHDDPDAGWVEGSVRSVSRAELIGHLDSYEGVNAGLYRRVVAATRRGRTVWLYVYARPLPAGARGPLPRWDGPAAVTTGNVVPD